MCKSIFSLAPAALVLMMAAGQVQAATNGQIIITGNVVAATCDVTMSTNNLDLGNHTPAAFTGVATPVPASVKKFTVGLSNCQVPLAAADTANLVVVGQTLGGNPNMFNTTGTNTGIMLSKTDTPTNYINANDKLLVATAGAAPSTGDFNGKVLTMQAGLASTTTSGVDIGFVNAPILFAFSYN